MFKIATRAKANPAKRDPFAIRTRGKFPREGALYHGAKYLIFVSETMRFIYLNCKKENCYTENMLWPVVAARQLWCWFQNWRYDFGSLMKCVYKVLIYHPAKFQHSTMIWQCCSLSWMLWGLQGVQIHDNFWTSGVNFLFFTLNTYHIALVDWWQNFQRKQIENST